MATAIHQYEDKLLDFAYGELPAPEASAVESHLKSCARCSQALDQIQGVRATMSALPQEPAPAAGLESLLAYAGQAAARNAAAPRAQVPWWRRIAAPLAGVCALTLVAVVAIRTQDDLDLSAQSAVLEAQPRKVDPTPVAAAPAPPEQPASPEQQAPAKDQWASPEKVGQKMKAGKTAGAVQGADRSKSQQAFAKNDDSYLQAYGETTAPGEERQRRGQEELGKAVAGARQLDAKKESKTRRAAATEDLRQDFGNARGGYAQNKAEEKAEKPADDAVLDSAKQQNAPLGISSATAKPAVPPPPAARPAPQPSPAAEVAAAEPAPSRAEAPETRKAPSLGLSMNSGTRSSGGSGVGSLGTGSKAGPSGSAYQQQPSREQDRDAEGERRDRELAARGYLDGARAASNRGNRQEEVKLALAVLQTRATGATRAEALSRLCTALEELGNQGQADKYCDALLTEFPNSAAARVLANRRNNLQRPAPAKRSATSLDESAADKAAEPAKAQPAAVDQAAH